MGMYTEVQLGVDIKNDISSENLEVLQWLVGGCAGPQPSMLPDHPFFTNGSRLWCMIGSSAYFVTGAPTLVVHRGDDGEPCWIELHFHASIKNYDREWENLLDWLSQLVDTSQYEFVGYYRYEEDNLPELLFFVDGKIRKESLMHIDKLQLYK